MKKQTKATAKKAAPKKAATKAAPKKTRLAIARRGQTAVSGRELRRRAKAEQHFTEVRQRVAESLKTGTGLGVPVPVPAPIPVPQVIGHREQVVHKPTDQSWRSKIDWVAAGKKAHETKLRNRAALEAIAAGATVPPVTVTPVTTGLKQVPRPTAPAAPAAKEEHTSTSTRSRPRIVSRTSGAPRRTSTSRSSASTRR